MDNVMKILWIAAGIIVTIFGISWGVNLLNQGKSTGDVAMNEMNELQTTLLESEFTELEGRIVFGNQVQSKVSDFADDEVAVQVITVTNTTWYNYSDENMSSAIDGAVNAANISSCRQKTATNYINPNAKFEVSLYRDANNVIKAVIFKQQ